MIHSATRSYTLKCSYNSQSWLDDPSSLISGIQSALSSIIDFSYKRLLIGNVKNASGKVLEIEIDGITYQSKTKLNANENDSLLVELNSAFSSIANFSYQNLTITNDVFRDEPTTGWPNQSFQEE